MEENTRIPIENKELEQEFFNFFREAITNVICFEDEKFQKEVTSVRRAVHSDKLKNKTKTKPWMEFSEKNVRCAYLLRYSVLNSVTLVEHLQNMQESNTTFLNELLSTNVIRICCLEGGAGFELVSIAKVVNTILNANCESEKLQKVQIRFTILDKCGDWEEWILPLAKILKNGCTILDKSKLDIRVRFKQVDLMEPWSEDVLKAIRKCDILTMVKFVSTFYLAEEENQMQEEECVLEDIAKYLKVDAKIFFLDYAGGGFCPMVQKHMKQYQYIEKLDSHLHQTHAVDIKLFSEELKSHNSFVNRMMLGKSVTTLSSVAWVKCVPKVKIKKKRSEKKFKVKTESEYDDPLIKQLISKPSEVALDNYKKHFLDENLLKS